MGDDPGTWPVVLSSIGLRAGPLANAGVLVISAGGTARIEPGAIVILEGESPLAASLGFKATAQRESVRSVEDLRAPQLKIIWEKAVDLPRFEIPDGARLFARDRHTGAPLMAGFKRGSGAVLWVATSPGERGYARFPYLPQALADLGLEPPFRSSRLWAFFDSAYRARADLDYLATRWRAAGIQALHVAAWHNWEPDAAADEYLRRLIEACHRRAIQVYAWIELPHVSERFWEAHPEWREKTALGQDAQLDWRKLINLANPEAARAAGDGLRALLTRFDWDGVNLAELYFESLEGHQNPARFTPMNRDVRAEFERAAGFDPADLFDPKSPRHYSRNAAGLARLLEYRADLARRLQTEWIGRIEEIRRAKPHLDLVLTHVDDRFDTTMREKIGADAARVLPLLASHDFTFLIEDPATIWNLGPQRYAQIAERYIGLTPAAGKLGIDINVVERYQDVYPLKQQTGVELFSLVHSAAASFPRVALYFENSIARDDLALLPAAAAGVTRAERAGTKISVTTERGAGVAWSGPAQVDGRAWPVASDSVVWLPSGAHTIEPASKAPALRMLDFNGDLKSAAALPDGLTFAYFSPARAFAILEHRAQRIEIDGEPADPMWIGNVVMLPRGQHVITLTVPDKQSAR